MTNFLILLTVAVMAVAQGQFYREDFYPGPYDRNNNNNNENRLRQLEDRLNNRLSDMERKMRSLEQQVENLQSTAHADWIRTDSGSQYKLFEQRRSWPEAQNTCKIYNSRLAVIDSEAKNTFVKDLFRNSSSTIDYAWIGVKTKAEVANAKQSQFSNFADDVQIDGCAVVDRSGIWSIRSCSQQRPFLCQQVLVA